MAFIQRDYIGRLPYGLWFDEEERVEYLFDRGYSGMASRPVDEPWKVTLLPVRRFIVHSTESWFYTDATSPRLKADYRRRAEQILCKFMLGHDVRNFIHDKSKKPKTGGKYLPRCLPPRDRRINLIGDNSD